MMEGYTPNECYRREGAELAKRLARRYAKKFADGNSQRHEQWVDVKDLEDYGMIGVLKAIERFDPTRGALFTTFAFRGVRGAILDGIKEITGLSSQQLRALAKEEKTVEIVDPQDPKTVGDQPTGNFESLYYKVRQLSALILLESDDGVSQTNEPADPGPGPEEIARRREIKQRIWQCVEKLPKTLRELIALMYKKGLTLTKAADKLTMHKSWASRQHARALGMIGRCIGRSSVD